MNMLIERVYETLTGQVRPIYALPGVENAFAEDARCLQLYEQMLQAYERLCARLGVKDEDADVEIIIQNLQQIEYELSHKMYHYGELFCLLNHGIITEKDLLEGNLP